MTEKLEEMWAELAKHQPIADKLGYGTQWQCMCGLKTKEAAAAAREAAWDAAWEATWAATAAREVVDAARDKLGAGAAWDAKRAIQYIQKANKLGGI